MITGEISFQTWAQDNNTPFECYKKNAVKNGWLKSRNLSEDKKTTPSTNIPLLSYEIRNNYFRIESRNNNKNVSKFDFKLSGLYPHWQKWFRID